MNYKKIQNFNSRILYSEISGPQDDWFSAFGGLTNFIEKESQISQFSGDLFLYFFIPSDDENFMESDIWVALEITGFVDLEESEEFGAYDLEKGDVFSFELPISDLDKLSLEYFTKAESECRRQLMSEHELANTWRLKIYENKADSWGVQLHFFPLGKEALN